MPTLRHFLDVGEAPLRACLPDAKSSAQKGNQLLPRLARNLTAQGVNFSLAALYELLAKNRISARRAAVLAYISSLILRTHPTIDGDNRAGITDPSKPKPMPKPDLPPSGAGSHEETVMNRRE